MPNPIKESYENEECPDCGESIPDNVEEGDECHNCGHVFSESPFNQETPNA